MELNNETILAHIESIQPGAVAASETGYDGILNIETSPEKLISLLEHLRDDETLHYHFLTTLNAIHYPEATGREICMVYHLHNWPQNRRVRVKVFIPIADPQIPSLTPLWPSANWMERQEYDFFGVQFTGHPNLTRILNVDDMDVFPMRKEYRLEDGTRTDKDDRFFGREGNYAQKFD
jgi:NADH-quinone oxidoreductase subunit C